MPDGLPVPRRYWSVAAIWLAMTMSVLDGAIANVALPTIAHELNATAAASIWIVNAYQLAITVTLLPLAALPRLRRSPPPPASRPWRPWSASHAWRSRRDPGPIRRRSTGRRPLAHHSAVALPVGLAQLAAQDLAGGVAGQDVDEVHRLGRLVAGDPLAGPGDHGL